MTGAAGAPGKAQFSMESYIISSVVAEGHSGAIGRKNGSAIRIVFRVHANARTWLLLDRLALPESVRLASNLPMRFAHVACATPHWSLTRAAVVPNLGHCPPNTSLSLFGSQCQSGQHHLRDNLDFSLELRHILFSLDRGLIRVA
jgi:hypothetical protein